MCNVSCAISNVLCEYVMCDVYTVCSVMGILFLVKYEIEYGTDWIIITLGMLIAIFLETNFRHNCKFLANKI